MLEISLVPGNSRRLAVNLTLPVSALWLTYICHIGLGGSSRSANGPVRLTLDISHSPCQWEVCIVFVCLLVSLLVCYKTSYPRPIPGTPLYLFRVWPWDPSPPCEVHAPNPDGLSPNLTSRLPTLGCSPTPFRLIPDLSPHVLVPDSCHGTTPTQSLHCTAGPSTLAAAWASGPPSLSPHPASDFRSKILAPSSQFHPGFPYTASLSTLARPLYKGPPPPPAHGPSTRSSLVA